MSTSLWTSAPLWLVLCLGLAACELRLDVQAELRRSGGGTLAVALEADSELLSEARGAGVDPLQAVADAGADLEGWTVTESEDDEGFREVRLQGTFNDEAAFEQASAEL